MAKRKNYYKVHRNKVKRKSTKQDVVSALLRIAFAMNNVADAVRNKKPIPEYLKGGVLNNGLEIVGSNKKPEIIIRKE